MISRVRIGGYKSFEDAEARLGSLSVVLGPLGSGRSNLLEALGLLGRVAQVDRLERSFDPPHRGRPEECFRSARLHLETELELSPRIPRALNAQLAEREKLEGREAAYTRVIERRLRYALALELSPDSAAVRLADELLEALTASGTPRRRRKAFLECDQTHGRFLARVEKQGSLRYFAGTRRRSLLSELSDLVYHPHVVACREELLGFRLYAFETSSLGGCTSAPAADSPGHRGHDLGAFLRRLAAEEAEALRRLEEKLRAVGLERIDRAPAAGTMLLGLRGDSVPLSLAPGGILKLVAISALLESSTPPSVALFDEPESGLDRAGIETLARLMRAAATGRRPTTQIVVVTHSADLAAHLEPATLIACRREPGRGTILEPLPPGDPDDLFRKTAIERALEGMKPRPAGAAPPRPRRR